MLREMSFVALFLCLLINSLIPFQICFELFLHDSKYDLKDDLKYFYIVFIALILKKIYMDFRIHFVIQGFCCNLNCFLDNARKGACLLIFSKIVSWNILYFSFKFDLDKSDKSNFIELTSFCKISISKFLKSRFFI